MDRLTSKATPEGTLNYSYDAAGNLASMQSADGAVNVSYTWNSLNLLDHVADSRLGTTGYQYDPANNLLTMTYPNQVQSTFTYDQLNRVSGAATGAAAYAYQRGPTGNLTSALESSNRQVTWSYDGIYRLTGETIASDPSRNNGSVSYSLDPVGNRLSDSSSLPDIPSGSWNFNADDEVSSESYDQNGNVIAAGGNTFAYDSQNQLTSMNGGAVQIVYDGDGNRVEKIKGGVATAYLVDDLNPTGYPQVVEELTNGAVARTYTYGLQRISEYQVVNGTPTASFYGYDGMGSVRQLTNSGGAVTDQYEYDAYGNKWTVSGTTPNNYLYRGEQYDPDLGLYYLRARYYNPLTGRFMSRDPEDGNLADPGTLLKYPYASGDPANRVDPSGRADVVEEDEETALIATVQIGRVTFARGAFWGGVGLTGLGLQLACMYATDTAALTAIGQHIGSPQTVQILSAICSAISHAPRVGAPPQPCGDNIGNCVPWVKGNRKPGDKIIHYKTVNPAPTCSRDVGERIFAAGLGGAPISETGFHIGLLRGGIVYDNIYPGGISQADWEGSAYEVPASCPLTPESVVTLDQAQSLGIGVIWISDSVD